MSAMSETGFKRACALIVAMMLAVPFASVAALPAYAVGPTTYWVDYAAGSNANPGTEAEPFETITYALSVAAAGDTVMIEPGLYEAANGEVFPLQVQGESLISVDGTATTIIDGTSSTSQLVYASGNLDGAEISGLTFRNASNDGPGAALQIYTSSGTGQADSPLIKDNYFANNAAAFAGGAVKVGGFASNGLRPRIEGNTFIGNHSDQQGGAIEIQGYISPTLISNVFVDNSTDGNGGAALILPQGERSVTLDGNQFVGNEAWTNGGACMLGGMTGRSEYTVARNRFFDNTTGARGGALFFSGDLGVVLSRNDAGGNSADNDGGFAFLHSGEVTSTNNAVGGHGAGVTGAAWSILDGRFRSYNDTIVDSQDSTSAVYATPEVDARLANGILWNEGMADVVGFDSVSYSDIRDTDVASKNAVGAGVISADPVWLDDAAHKPDIGAGSPCIDAASPLYAPADDFYGVARPVDGDGDGVAKPDMGCCERNGTRTAMTFSAPAVCDYGSVKVAGTLKDHLNAALAYKPLTIQYSYNNFATVAGSKATTTNVFGAFTASFAPTRRTYYRAVYTGTDTQLGSRVTRSVLPRAYLPKPYSTSLQTYGKSYTLRGSLKPQHAAGSTVRIRAYRYSSGKYRYKKTYYAKLYNYEGYSKYRIKIKLPRSGRWAFRAYHPVDSLNAKTYSAYRYVRVR